MGKSKGPSAAALAKFTADFEKRFGQGTIRSRRKYEVVSTGSLTVDCAMGCGGYVVGRIAIWWGPESAAKTTMAVIGAKQFQDRFPGKLIGWIDMERTFDWKWAEAHGVDMGRIKILTPQNSEDVSDMAKHLIRTGMFSLVVLDSVGGMVTEEEMDKDAEEASVGTAAKIITRMVKTAAVLCDEMQTTMIIVNQVRANIGYGGDTTQGGGFALKHVSTHTNKIKRTGTPPYSIGTGDNKQTVGFELSVTIEKNKVAPPRRVATFALFVQPSTKYGSVGIDRVTEAVTLGKRFGIIDQQPGGYYVVLGAEDRIRGEKEVIAYLRENPATVETIRTLLLEKLSDQVAEEVPEEDSPEMETDGLDFATGAASIEVDITALDDLRAQPEVAAEPVVIS